MNCLGKSKKDVGQHSLLQPIQARFCFLNFVSLDIIVPFLCDRQAVCALCGDASTLKIKYNCCMGRPVQCERHEMFCLALLLSTPTDGLYIERQRVKDRGL